MMAKLRGELNKAKKHAEELFKQKEHLIKASHKAEEKDAKVHCFENITLSVIVLAKQNRYFMAHKLCCIICLAFFQLYFVIF